MKNKRGSSSKLMLALTIIGFGLAMVSYLANELSPNSDGSQQAVPAARTSAQPILTGLVISGGGAGSSNAPGFISSSDDRASAKKEPSTCIDSDGGTNYNAKGTATASSAKTGARPGHFLSIIAMADMRWRPDIYALNFVLMERVLPADK